MFLPHAGASQVDMTIVIEYSLEMGQSACPGEYIVFTCVERGSHILSWSSDEYTDGVLLDFTTEDPEGTTKYINNSDTYATLISVVKGSDSEASLESVLHIRSNKSSPVSCIAGNGEKE